LLRFQLGTKHDKQLSQEKEVRMRTNKNSKIWILVLLSLSFVPGCGDPDKNGNIAGVSPNAPPPVTLGTTVCSFGILGATPVVSNVGPTHVTGDVGISPAASITGFTLTGGPGTITGAFHAGDAVAATAQAELTTAYNKAAGAAGGAALPADIGGLVLTPGVYKTTSSQPSLGITGNLTLDGGGDPNGVWIFQIVSTLTTAAGNSHIILINGANSHNVTWQIGSSATLGTNTIFQGTMMAMASITLTTGATLNGRALARTGAVSLDTNQVNVPPCP
jgi:Ice-binding-like